MDTQIIEQETSKVTGEIATVTQNIIERAEQLSAGLKFPNKENYALADTCYNSLHKAWTMGEKTRLNYTAPINEALKKINTTFKAQLDPIALAKLKMKGAMDRYATEKMLWKRKEEARVQAEKRAVEEEAFKAAQALEAAGKPAEAAKTLDKEIDRPVAPVLGATDKAKTTIRTRWVAQIDDLKVFIRACAEDPSMADFFTIEMGTLNTIAQATKGGAIIPGVSFREEASVGARI